MQDSLTTPTELYGASDDLLELEGGINGEHGCYDTSDDEPLAVFLSDGSVLSVWYGDSGIWKITVCQKGSLFDKLDPCTDPDAERHSDTAHFRPGLKWAYATRSTGPLKPIC